MNTNIQTEKKLTLPSKILLLGFGAIGKCFAEILLKSYPNSNLIICDAVFPEDFSRTFSNFKVEKIHRKITKENLAETFNFLSAGDLIVDLSTDIGCLEVWGFCQTKGILYLNTSFEEWEDCVESVSFPRDLSELYKASVCSRKENISQSHFWNKEQTGATAVFQHGMNPGLISHCMKKGLFDAAKYFLDNRANTKFSNFDYEKIQKYLNEKNYPKLAQELKLFSVHCAESDNQTVEETLENASEKLYNTWSGRAFLSEVMIPIGFCFGSHEDKETNDRFPRVDDKIIMSWNPSRLYLGN